MPPCTPTAERSRELQGKFYSAWFAKEMDSEATTKSYGSGWGSLTGQGADISPHLLRLCPRLSTGMSDQGNFSPGIVAPNRRKTALLSIVIRGSAANVADWIR